MLKKIGFWFLRARIEHTLIYIRFTISLQIKSKSKLTFEYGYTNVQPTNKKKEKTSPNYQGELG